MAGRRKQGFDLSLVLSYNTSIERKNVHQNKTGGFEHAVSSGREQQPNALIADSSRKATFQYNLSNRSKEIAFYEQLHQENRHRGRDGRAHLVLCRRAGGRSASARRAGRRYEPLPLLEAAGFIKVDPAAGYTPEIKDITDYLYNVEVTPVAANTLPSTLGDFAASTINGTYAVPYGLIPSRDALLIEKQDENGENPYVNVIVARTADKDNEVYQKVVEAYQTQLVAEFLLVNYHETFYPAFAYDADAAFSVTEENVAEISGYKSSKDGKTVVKVGVCGGVGNNEQWIATQKVLDDEGANIYIDLVEFDAYNLPNEALNSGDIDLNAFQHKAYLAKDCSANGYDLTVIGDTLIAPLCIYSEKYDSIDAIKEAAGAK